MELGIFETTFPRPTLAAALDAVAGHGLRWVQLDLASVGLPSLPDAIPDAVVEQVRRETNARQIRLAAVSGTYNMIHPDPRVRAHGLVGLRAIAAACRGMGASVITLCSGTRDADSMWREHPENASPEAWRDLIEAMTNALAIAEEHDVTLAVEPEPANVVASAALGQRLRHELGNSRLMFVLDAANIVASDRSRTPATILDEAFALLGEDIAVAHAKDLDADGRFCAAGRGIVPWAHCLTLFRDVDFGGPLVLHSLMEDDVDRAVAFLRQKATEAGAS